MKNAGKLAAPIVVTVLGCLWLIGWALACIFMPEILLWMKLVGLIMPLGLLGVMIFVLVERIYEIRSGEEDDLSNY